MTNYSFISTISRKINAGQFILLWRVIIYLVAACIFISLCIVAFSKNKYRVAIEVPISFLQSRSEAIINPDQKNRESSNFGLQQIAYLHSKGLLEKALDDLNLEISYYKIQTLKNVQLSENASPVKISIIKNDLITDQQFEVDIIKNRFFEIDNAGKMAVHSFGQKIIEHGLEFTITKTSQLPGLSRVLIKIKDLNDLSDTYSKQLNWQFKDRDKVILSLPANNNKADSLLLKIRQLFLQNNQEANSAEATINDINKQLDSLNKSLKVTQKKIEQLKNLKSTKQPPLFEKQTIDKLSLKKKLDILNAVEHYVKIPANEFSFVPNTFDLQDNSLKLLINEINDSQLEKQKIAETEKPNSDLSTRANNLVINLKSAAVKKIDSLKEQTLDLLHGRQNIVSNKKTKSTQNEIVERMQEDQQARVKLYLYLMQKRENLRSLYQNPNGSKNNLSSVKFMPIKKPVPVVLFIGLLIALIPPVVYVNFNKYEKQKWTLNEILKQTDVPLLGVLNEQNQSEKIIYPIEYDSVIGKQFLKIKTNIENRPNKQLLIFTSVNAGAGKSFIAANSAATLAFAGKKVLLIQTGLTSLSKYLLSVVTTKGLNSYLNDQLLLVENIIDETAIPNLSLITPGIPEMSEALRMKRLETLLQQAKSLYDFIIIDSYPMSNYAIDKLSKIPSGIIVNVVNAGNITKRQLSRFNSYYNSHPGKSINMIINHID